MKKKLFIILLVCSICRIVNAQNLVPNYSFENITTCPNSTSELNLATPWFMPLHTGNATSDLFNACNTTLESVPSNVCSYQPAHTGGSYAGIFTYGGDCREYIEVQLLSPLIAGNIYNVEMYVNPSNVSGIAGDAMGIYFSTDSIAGNGTYFPLPYTPQISNPSGNIISDTVGWTLISGSYTSLGGENFITIGSFLTDSNTHSLVYNSPGWARGYYFIDDVSVTENATTGIKHAKSKDEISIYPNPNNGSFKLNYALEQDATLYIYDIQDKQVFNINLPAEQTSIDINNSDFQNGMYIYKVLSKNTLLSNGKLAIHK